MAPRGARTRRGRGGARVAGETSTDQRLAEMQQAMTGMTEMLQAMQQQQQQLQQRLEQQEQRVEEPRSPQHSTARNERENVEQPRAPQGGGRRGGRREERRDRPPERGEGQPEGIVVPNWGTTRARRIEKRLTVTDEATLMKGFRDLSPRTFNGEGGPSAVGEWIRHLNKKFAELGAPDYMKTRMAASVLEGAADEWWELETKETGPEIAWSDFQRQITDTYFPAPLREQKRREFADLEQGNMTVREYEARFQALCRYATHQIENDFDKARRFEQGLRPEIRDFVVAVRSPTFRETVMRAMAVEQSHETRKQKEAEEKKVAESSRDGGRPFKKNRYGNHRHAPIPPRPRLFGQQDGQRNQWVGRCYICGDQNHRQANCPRRQGRQNPRYAPYPQRDRGQQAIPALPVLPALPAQPRPQMNALEPRPPIVADHGVIEGM